MAGVEAGAGRGHQIGHANIEHVQWQMRCSIRRAAMTFVRHRRAISISPAGDARNGRRRRPAPAAITSDRTQPADHAHCRLVGRRIGHTWHDSSTPHGAAAAASAIGARGPSHWASGWAADWPPLHPPSHSDSSDKRKRTLQQTLARKANFIASSCTPPPRHDPRPGLCDCTAAPAVWL